VIRSGDQQLHWWHVLHAKTIYASLPHHELFAECEGTGLHPPRLYMCVRCWAIPGRAQRRCGIWYDAEAHAQRQRSCRHAAHATSVRILGALLKRMRCCWALIVLMCIVDQIWGRGACLVPNTPSDTWMHLSPGVRQVFHVQQQGGNATRKRLGSSRESHEHVTRSGKSLCGTARYLKKLALRECFWDHGMRACTCWSFFCSRHLSRDRGASQAH